MSTPRADRSLGSEIAKGTFWTVSMRLTIRCLGFVSIIVLARILTPEDYGIAAQAVLVYSFLELMTAFGLDNALIQNQGATASHYDTVWTIQIIRGVAIAFFLVVLAGPTSHFFHQPELESIIYVYAFVSVLNGLFNVGIVDFRKKFRFHKDFQFNVSRRIVGFLVTLYFAYQLKNYWAFVLGTVASAATGLMISYYLSRYRPRFRLTEWRSLFHFSKWVLGYQLIGAVTAKLDTFILSKFSGSQQLGLYTIAVEVSGTASTEIAMPVGRAMLPGLSAISDDQDAFQALYLRSVSTVLAIAVPAALGVSALADEITLVLLGEKWADAAPIIFLLAFQGIGRVIASMSSSAFVSFGRVDMITKLSITNLTISTIALSTGYYLGGFWGLIWGVLGVSLFNALLSMTIQSVIGQLRIMQLIANTWRVALSSIVMWFALQNIQIGSTFGELGNLLAMVLIGVAVYILGLFLLWHATKPKEGPERQIFVSISEKLRLQFSTKTR